MNRSKFIYLTDLILVFVFVLSFYTGVELHIAGHGINHATWHNWAVFHTIVSLLFMALGIIHIRSHWGWYGGLKRKGCKGKVVLLLSIVFVLFFVNGANSSIGLLHYKTGIVVGVLGVLHVLERKRMLYKGVLTCVFGKKKE